MQAGGCPFKFHHDHGLSHQQMVMIIKIMEQMSLLDVLHDSQDDEQGGDGNDDVQKGHAGVVNQIVMEKNLKTSILIHHFERGDCVDAHPDCRDHHKHH